MPSGEGGPDTTNGSLAPTSTDGCHGVLLAFGEAGLATGWEAGRMHLADAVRDIALSVTRGVFPRSVASSMQGTRHLSQESPDDASITSSQHFTSDMNHIDSPAVINNRLQTPHRLCRFFPCENGSGPCDGRATPRVARLLGSILILLPPRKTEKRAGRAGDFRWRVIKRGGRRSNGSQAHAMCRP